MHFHFAIASVSVPIVPVILYNLSLPICLSIFSPEPPIHQRHKDNEKELRRNSAPDTSSICWVLLLHKRAGGVDAADGSEEHLNTARDGSARSTSDVVGLEGDDGWEIGIAAGYAEEDSWLESVYDRGMLSLGKT